MKNEHILHKKSLGVRAAAFVTIIALTALSACLSSLQGNQTAEGVPSSVVELQCTQACAERGQCGTAADRRDRVLLSSQPQPVVEGHDIAIEVGSRAVIQETITETLVTVATTQQFAHQFYRIQVEGTAIQGWVAQWCTVPVN